MRYSKRILATLLGAGCMQAAVAAPATDEVAQLGKVLTPVGAIRAGNQAGTIPEWTGGVCTPPANYKPRFGPEKGGAPYADPFADDKPLFRITAENIAAHADKVDEGTRELLRRFPKTFHMNVYPTRRSACFPNWVYENTIRHVARPKIVGGNIPALSGAHAQFPFPVPRNGVEAVWNKMVFFDRVLQTSQYLTFYVDSAGKRTMIDSDLQHISRPYWDNSIEMIPEDKPYYLTSADKQYPPSAFGNGMVIHTFARPDLRGNPVWSYIPGQRRVRQAPEFAYDGVAPSAGGTFLYDEGSGFSGKMDRFDFNLIGRKEYYIPYNSSEERLNRAEAAGPDHVDPEAVRWELHRVWVVEATLKPGERHVQKKKVLYIDEDSWHIAIYYGMDHADKVHHLFHFHTAQFYDKPGIATHAHNAYDLSKGAYTHWIFSGTSNGITSYGFRKLDSVSPAQFTAEGMTGRGVR